jgi:4-hydroxy-tetrahydrodipicolinate reductase
MTKLCLTGGMGRMGRVIASLVAGAEDLEIASVFESREVVDSVGDYGAEVGYSGPPVLLTSEASEAVERADAVVDFSLPAAFDEVVAACNKALKPLVTGTTGIRRKEEKLRPLADKVAVVSAPNMSVGMNVVFALCHRLGDVMGKTSDLEIVETHHRTKKDVPSGTAMEIAAILGAATGKPVVVGRPAGACERADEITVHSLRAGDVAGIHSIFVMPKGESLEITHTARSRVCFAEGALRAVRFVVRSSPGLYSMLEVLGLRTFKEGRP